jgi:hypothetical protein
LAYIRLGAVRELRRWPVVVLVISVMEDCGGALVQVRGRWMTAASMCVGSTLAHRRRPGHEWVASCRTGDVSQVGLGAAHRKEKTPPFFSFLMRFFIF